jgi:LPS sulfotransferase NodH
MQRNSDTSSLNVPELMKFIVAGQQRTGTTMLVRTLDQHENICCRGEMFVNRFPNRTRGSYEMYIRQSLQRRASHFLWRKHCTDRYLDEVFSAPRYLFTSESKWRHCQAIGFKMMYSQTRKTPAALKYVKDRKLPVVLLIRRNSLRVLVSREVNKVLEVPHSTESVATTRVKVDAGDLLRSLQKLEDVNLQWEQLVSSNPYLKVFYEDVVNDLPRELNRITDFLGVSRAPGLRPPIVKLNSAAIADIVTNYDEVAKRLQGTAFEACLGH